MLNNKTVSEFTTDLASNAPTPGGGSVAALIGALGVSLTGMVAALTVGNSRYAASHTLMQQVIQEANELRLELVALIDKDAEAFSLVSAAFAMPKSNEDEIKRRREAIQAALHACTKPPLEIMHACMRALRVTEKAIEGYNPSAASDLGVAALGLGAAMRSAWLNILINLGGITDVDCAAQFRAEGEALLAVAIPLSEKIYHVILDSL